MLNIFKPEYSEVVKGIEGKVIFLYGANRTGKTSNAVKAEKPVVFACENGLNAIPGIPMFPVNKWLDFVNLVDQLVENKNEIKEKGLYSTIIVDGLDSFCLYADKYICGLYGVKSIGDAKNGYGAWKEYGNTMSYEINRLTNCGFTVIFIGHDTEKEYGEGKNAHIKIVPRGDKRAWEPICDIADVIGYARIIEEGKNATLFLKGSPDYTAGSRFDDLVPYIEEWDMTKLTRAIQEAIESKEKTTNIKAIEYKDSRNNKEVLEVSVEDIKTRIQTIVEKMSEIDPTCAEYVNILDSLLGVNGRENFSIAGCTPMQRDLLETILSKLEKTKIGKSLK